MESAGLMDLIKECEKRSVMAGELDQEQVGLLADTGFKTASAVLESKLRFNRAVSLGYTVIQPEDIQRFLQKKAEAYNETRTIVRGLDEDLAAVLRRVWGPQLTGQRLGTTLNPGDMIHIPINNGLLAPETAIGSSLLRYSSFPFATSFAAATVDRNSTDPAKIGQFAWVEENIEETSQIPPTNVLVTLKETKAKNIFDYFTIAHLEKMPDPLLLGRILKREERFFIRQWDNDITLDDLIGGK